MHARTSLADWPMAQHHIAGEFHMPMMLRQFFVTLEQNMPLRPGPYVGLAHGLGEGDGLVAMDMFDVFGNVLLQRMYRLPNLGHCPLGAKFGITVTGHLTPTKHYSEPVMCQPHTVGQNRKW